VPDPTTTLDLTPIVQPILTVCGVVVTSLIAYYGPKVLAVFQARTGIALTDQQRATVLGAVQTAAGELETAIDQKALTVDHIHVDNQAVLQKAQSALQAVPVAMQALGMNEASVAKMIVGAVETGTRMAPAPARVPPGAAPTVPPPAAGGGVGV
jgi:hypothetical protein